MEHSDGVSKFDQPLAVDPYDAAHAEMGPAVRTRPGRSVCPALRRRRRDVRDWPNPLCGFAIGDLPWAATPGIVLFVLMWEVMLWRVVLVGVYVSDDGIKIRMGLYTRVIPWSRVTRSWAGQAANYDAWQIWVSAGDPERDFATPIWRRGSGARHRNRVLLAPEEFAAVLAALDSRH